MFAPVDRGYDTECWIWQLSKTRGGYGQIVRRINGKQRNQVAHRMVWEATHGPIAPGLELDHLCRQRDCVRPLHLEPVTKSLNCARARPYRKGTKLDADAVRSIRASNKLQRELAAEYGVHERTIWAIISGRTWAYLLDDPPTDTSSSLSRSCRLTETAVRRILTSTDTQCSLAAEFGVTQSTISKVQRRKTWTGVTS